MAALRSDVLSAILLLVCYCDAQYPRGSAPNYPHIASEGPCGRFMFEQQAPRRQAPLSATGHRRVVRQVPFNQQAAQPLNPPAVQRPNLAVMLGVPPPLTVYDAAVMELDPAGPYDMDMPDPNSLQPGMMDVATAGGQVNTGLAQPQPAFNQQQPTNTLVQRTPIVVDQRQQPSVPTQNVPASGYPYPNQYPAMPPYSPQVNCQCDSAGDCNMNARSMGVYMGRSDLCMVPGDICCCRVG